MAKKIPLKIKAPAAIKNGFCNSQDLKCENLQFVYGGFDWCLLHQQNLEQKKACSPINKKYVLCTKEPMVNCKIWS